MDIEISPLEYKKRITARSSHRDTQKEMVVVNIYDCIFKYIYNFK